MYPPRLLLLDVNGLICTKVKVDDPVMEKLEPTDYIEINRAYHVILRPKIKQILLDLSHKYTVAIYSSTNYRNIIKIVKGIFGDQDYPFAFIADRLCTVLDPAFGSDPEIESHDTIKVLDRIWEHPMFNVDRKWNSDNTVLIEHDIRKIYPRNPIPNLVLVPEFTVEDYLEGDADIDTLVETIESCPLLQLDV